MSAVKELRAVARDRVGKGAARAVRRSGQTPAVIYGGGDAPAPIALDANEMRLLIFGGHFLTTIFEVEVDGRKTRVIPRDYHLDPVKDLPLHVDFLRITAGQTITVEVPVHFLHQDTAPGIKAGGVLNVVRHAIEVEAPADQIPEAIEVDLSGVEMGDSVHISAVTLPPGVKPTIDRDFTIATIAAPAGLGAKAEAQDAAVSQAAKAESDAAKQG
ncbi:50S ribosomal protein L25/general stress protein Ctc [Enterovirga sp.]|jgi:large subunit ribosomal protein L25|uniref:50S ribosomal protein L25/general stress protein Ctc n=1 Tax=Enterovirga sp. TaxID=2026350 RepID=UPI00263778E7|nr:50S ribosomal protein L25/general stress protein Ctc [Enterovirga sp.]MDB5591407.1 ribosomal protein [Enterovirga sp.]